MKILKEFYIIFISILISLPISIISVELGTKAHIEVKLIDKLKTNDPSTSLSEGSSNETFCIMKKDGHIYDLSSISGKNYWFYNEISNLDTHLIFLLSVCHPIQNISSCNNSRDGACFSYASYSKISHDMDSELQEDILNKISFTSGGEISSKYPEVVQEGSLKYVYENGGVCIKGNKNVKYKTELHLQCPLSSEDESSGPILMSSPKCLFIFVWMTLAACPKNIDKTSDPCIIKFSNSEYPLNLHSLHSDTFYRARGINSSYEINICGPIVNGSCPDNTAVCDITDPKNPIVLTTSESVYFDWQDDALILSYKSTVYSQTTNIYLYCDRIALVPKFFFSSKSSNTYNFSVYTINVCNPQSSDCVFEDKKLNVYDLRPLHKKDGNWEVIGRKSDNNVLFNLNVCGPINQNTGFKCPPGPVGACQASVSSAGSRNIGYITSNPVANEVGTLTLMYTGGDSCRDGIHASSTRITFICSNINYPPAFLKVTDSCEHLFEWHTPAACPVNVASSNNCEITDPLFGHNFDLGSLRNTTSDFHVTNGNQNFNINVCGPLISPCGKSQNTTAVCQRGEEDISGGEMPAELVFNDGTLTMKFSKGAPGCGDDQWTTQILFLCSHEEKGSEGLQYIHADESSCVHHFIWHTKRACPPHEETSCMVKDGDVVYDLTPLSDPNVNEIFITSSRDRKYVLNVCRSVIHSKESRCAYDAGACLIDIGHENKTLSLGKVTSGPYIESRMLKLKYENGDSCNGTHNYSTVIEFECTKEQYLSFPILIAEEECITLFKWTSIYACPQNTSLTQEVKSEGNCTAVNPLTNYIFDMNTLKAGKPRELLVREGTVLLLSVCGNVSDARCPGNGSGACIVSKGTSSSSAGKSNQDLNFRMWSTYLEYEGGEECSSGLKRSTRISFICQDDESKSGPVLISDDESACTYFVNWYTEEACERHIRCFAHSFDHSYDLSSLVRVWGNYEVKDPTDPLNTYLINVCRPLNPVIGVNCHPGSSSCLVRKNEEPLGLGHPILNPNVGADDSVHLMYAHGSACPDQPGIPLSSRIIFICNRTAGVGTPTFLKKPDECQVQFEWQTSLVCPPTLEEGQCQIAFEAAKANVDLSPLKDKGPYRVTYKDTSYLINLCGATVCDNSSAVCSDGKSYGKSAQAKLRWDHDSLLLAFYGGATCKEDITGARSTRIFFECDPNRGFGFPEADPIMDDLTCMAIFTWKTNLTCLESLYKPSKAEPSSVPANTTSPSTTKTTDATHYSPPEPHTENEDMSQHTWVSVLIACLVIAAVIAASAYVVGRSSHGRRMYARAKRTLSRKGDQAFILDDHL